ncbi:hypothetical protein BH18ACT9_BH18ACT9_07490 [soil metagenome]
MSYEHDLDTVIKTLQSIDPEQLRATPAEMRTALEDVVTAGQRLWTAPMPDLVTALIETARVDLVLARLVEGHADAMRILDQADEQIRPGVYGVWARSSTGTSVTGQFREGRWALRGELDSACGLHLIDRALVPVWVNEAHQLLDLPLAAGIASGSTTSWRTDARDAIRPWTVQIDADASINATVGPRDWFLDRAGFVVGGLGMAAVWAGGAQLVLDLVIEAAGSSNLGAAQLRLIGTVDQAVWEARTVLGQVASLAEDLSRAVLAVEIGRARMSAAQACERVVTGVDHLTGVGGLTPQLRLTRAMQDLRLCVRQYSVVPELEGRGRYLVYESDQAHDPSWPSADQYWG